MNAALSRDQINETKPVVPAGKGLAGFTFSSFTEVLLNPFNIGFAVLMPVLMYLMFGASQAYSSYSVGSGNVAAQILISMTLFGVLLTTASFGANVSLQRAQGVSRLYALTPMRPALQLLGRMLAIVAVGVVVVAVTFTVGALTGAQMAGWTWVMSIVMMIPSSLVGIMIGLGCGFAVRSDGAFAATSAIVVLGAFGAGLTVPLEQLGGFFQALAPWTPLWGAGQLALLPLVGWASVSPVMVVNLIVWMLLFSALAVWGLRRDTGR